MSDSCSVMDDSQDDNKRDRRENKLDKYTKRVTSLYQIDQGLKRAQDYRLKQYWIQSERLRRQVQRVRDTAESRKEAIRQVKLKKQQILDKTLSDAQLRRNQHLETARQTAKEHFIKVQKIANSNYVSKRVLLWRRKAQSQSQLWNAEWRRSRALVLKVRKACLSPGTKYPSQLETYPVDVNYGCCTIQEKHEAASIIQSFWRLHFVERIFSNLNLTWERCAEEGFEVTKNKILDEQAEKAAASVVRLFYPRSRNTSGSEMKRLSRLFLTSFIIAAHPQHVLEQPDCGLEKSVVDSARCLLGYFMDPQLNAITLAVKARSSWTKYRVLYEQWERSDRERLIDGIMKDYMELETMKLKVDNGVITKQAALNGHRRMSPNVAPWKGKEPQTIGAIWLPQIRKRQSRLRAALFRVGGYKALDTLQSSIQHIQARFENLVDHSEEGKQQENVPKNDGSAISKDEYEYAQNGLNEIFAHEMMIDVEKFIKELETPEAYTKLLIIAKQAYRDRLQQALCTSGDAEPEKVSVDKQFVRLIAEVRDKLVAVLLQNAGEATENCKWRLENLLDMDILRNQICHYAFTVEDAIQLLKLFTEALRTIQADEELKNWEDSWFSEIANFDCSLQVQKRKLLSIVGQKLCDILDRLDMIEKDIIISKIRILEPVLKCYGPQWEDTRFQEKIHTGTFEKQLPQTSIWLTNSMKRLKQVYTTFDCLHLIQEGEGVYLKRFLQASFIYLIEYKDENIVPEVLKLDERRLLMLRENLYKCVYFTSFDLIVRRFVKQKNIEWDSTIEQRWRDLLVFWKEKNLTSLETHMNKELLSFMETIFQGQSEILLSQQDKAFLFSLWRQVVCGNEPISSLLKRRIVDFLYRTFLFHVSWTNPRKQLHSLGFGIVVDDIIDMLETMKQTTIHMLAVHLYRLKPIVLRIAKVIVNE